MMIKRYPDSESLARAAAELFVQCAQEAIAARGRFLVALSGGSTPKAMHHILADAMRDQVAWDHVHVFWGDERCVPPDHADSNYRMARETLLDHVPIPPEQVYRVHAELDPQAAAETYARTLQVQLPDGRFDLIYLGMGYDGHTLSLFPHTEALRESERWVVANYVPTLEAWRLTTTPALDNQARCIAFLVSGEKKADALHAVLRGAHLPEQYPAQLIQPREGDLLWYVDTEAARLL